MCGYRYACVPCHTPKIPKHDPSSHRTGVHVCVHGRSWLCVYARRQTIVSSYMSNNEKTCQVKQTCKKLHSTYVHTYERTYVRTYMHKHAHTYVSPIRYNTIQCASLHVLSLPCVALPCLAITTYVIYIA